MQKLFLPLCLMSLTLLVGCDEIGIGSSSRYTGENDADGNFLILDRQTGDIDLLKNEQLVDIPKENDIAYVKTYPSQDIPGMPIEIGGIKLKFRDGYLLYKGHMKPIIQTKNQGQNISVKETSALFDRMEALWEGDSLPSSRQITIKLHDIDGFDVFSVSITRGGMTRTVDHNSNPLYLSFEGARQISPKDFKAISGYNLRWNLADWE